VEATLLLFSAILSPFTYSFDVVGNLYIADYGNHAIRYVDLSTGIISTFAGTGSEDYSGDGGLAVDAALDNPNGIALDSAGTHKSFTFLFYSHVELSRQPVHR
jgi:hypothetical protein